MKKIIFVLLFLVLLFTSCTSTTESEPSDPNNINYLYIDSYPDELYCNVLYYDLPAKVRTASYNYGCDELIFNRDDMTVEVWRDTLMFVHEMGIDDLIGYIKKE